MMKMKDVVRLHDKGGSHKGRWLVEGWNGERWAVIAVCDNKTFATDCLRGLRSVVRFMAKVGRVSL